MPHSKDGQRLQPAEARAGSGHVMTRELGKRPLETQGLV